MKIVGEILNEKVNDDFLRGQYFKYVFIPELGDLLSPNSPEKNIININEKSLHDVLASKGVGVGV